MDEVSAKVRLADEGVDSPLAVAVPRTAIGEALQAEGADLLLDLVRQNGEREERRVSLALDREALERLMEQAGDQVLVTLDAETLARAFDEDVEAHGLREVGATLAILVTAVAGGAGIAGAAVDEGGAQAGPPAYVPFQTDFPVVQASVQAGDYGMPRAMPSDYAATEAPEAGMPRAMPSDYATAGVPEPGADIESIRAGQSVTPVPSADIETVRAGGSAIPDADSAIENVRATRTAPEVGDTGGVAIDAPSAGVTAALAGGAALTIAAAAFALRRRREPQPAT